MSFTIPFKHYVIKLVISVTFKYFILGVTFAILFNNFNHIVVLPFDEHRSSTHS